MMDATQLLRKLDSTFLKLALTKENLFWDVYMGISDDHAGLEAANLALESFIGDRDILPLIDKTLDEKNLSEDQTRALKAWRRTIEANSLNPAAVEILAELLSLESRISKGAEAGVTMPNAETGELEPANSTALRAIIQSDPDPKRRKQAWDRMRWIENQTLEAGLPEAYILRNRLARACGYENFYAMRLAQSETWTPDELFSMLQEVMEKTRPAATRALEFLTGKKGSAVDPWDLTYLGEGSLAELEHPYFHFGNALERWLDTFRGLGISYNGAFVTVDLLNRDTKHPNGFMHIRSAAHTYNGSHYPASINFTSTGIPGKVGDGKVALETLLHEGGHAAHFANMCVPSPVMSQEFAPTSIAWAETQSMFLDSLMGDADWLTRYARNADGEPIPFELIKKGIEMAQPTLAFRLRWLIAVPMAEYQIYRLPDDQITSKRIFEIFRACEVECFGIEGPRPIGSISHVRSRDSSAYYHAYAIAELALRQLRQYFLNRDGHLVDNPMIGPDLMTKFWRDGNERSFDEFFESLTGSPLTAEAAISDILMTADEAVDLARQKVARLADIPGPVLGTEAMNLALQIVHGDRVIFGGEQPLTKAADAFRKWIASGDY